MEDSTDHYLLSSQTHSHSKEPEWREIRVKVDRFGVTVSARSGVMIAPSLEPGKAKREQITAALASAVDLPGLRLELQPIQPQQRGKELTLSLLMRSDPEQPGVWRMDGVDFTVAGIAVSGGRVVQRFCEDIHGFLPREISSSLDTSGLTWTHKIAAPNDATVVRLVVRDNATGRIGSITRSLP